MNNNKPNAALPFLFAVVLAFGMILGAHMTSSKKIPYFSISLNAYNKFSQLLNLIDQKYVDTVSINNLEEAGINGMLNRLDPHTAYIPTSELKAMNEPLEGNFDGIGIEFNILNDTIMIISPIGGGPSEALGIKPGDRIIKIEEANVAGTEISTNEVIKRLRGPRGTKVKITIYRKTNRKYIDFTITRDKIPINSIDVSYMINLETGYIKISRFSQSTREEFVQTVDELKKEGLKCLILDMRGNPGGYLNIASQLADEFIEENKLIVYTEGRSHQRQSYYSTNRGCFEKGNIVILIDEGSASASEIVAGAVQDWDRGLIVGRRSFGKGMVQEQAELPDGSAIRLTIARYFTPTGRCIQKPYENGNNTYYQETIERYLKGEFLNKDSIVFDEKLKFNTPGGRIVYGGGGIMPDVFVPVDTTGQSLYLSNVISKGLINSFAFNYVDENRITLVQQYKTFNNYHEKYVINTAVLNSFVNYAKEQGVEPDDTQINLSKIIIKTQLKAHIARQIWGNDGFYFIIHEIDNTFQKAIEVISSEVLATK